MSDSPPDRPTLSEPAWLPLKAAAERLGLSADGLLKRIRRGQLQGQRDNHGRWLIRIDTLSEADKNRRPQTRPDKPDKLVAELKARIDELEAERDGLQAERASLEADLHGTRRDLDAAQAALSAAKAETAETKAATERRINELSGSIRQLSETMSAALSEATAREARVLSEADKTREWATSEADRARAEMSEARRIIAEFQAMPWWRRLLGR